MKKIQISKEDIKQYFRQRKERRQEILEKRRNSKLAKAMAPIYLWMNRFSIVLHLVQAFTFATLHSDIKRRMRDLNPRAA